MLRHPRDQRATHERLQLRFERILDATEADQNWPAAAAIALYELRRA